MHRVGGWGGQTGSHKNVLHVNSDEHPIPLRQMDRGFQNFPKRCFVYIKISKWFWLRSNFSLQTLTNAVTSPSTAASVVFTS